MIIQSVPKAGSQHSESDSPLSFLRLAFLERRIASSWIPRNVMQIDLVQQPFSAKGVRMVEHSLHKSFFDRERL